MSLYSWIVFYLNAWNLTFYTVVGVDKIQSGPLVAVALDVTAAENWSIFSHYFQITVEGVSIYLTDFSNPSFRYTRFHQL